MFLRHQLVFITLQPCPLQPSFQTEAIRVNPHAGPCPSRRSALLEASRLQQASLPPQRSIWSIRPGHTAPVSAGEASGPLPPDRRFTVYNLACVKHLSAGSSSLGRPPRQRACRKRLRAQSARGWLQTHRTRLHGGLFWHYLLGLSTANAALFIRSHSCMLNLEILRISLIRQAPGRMGRLSEA